MTPLYCQSKISSFAKANFYSKNSPRSHTFHITLNWNRNVHLYTKAYWKILVWTSCMTPFSIFLSKDCFLQIIFWDHKLQSIFLCVVWLRMMLFDFFFILYTLYNTSKSDYTRFHKDIGHVTNIAAVLIKEFFGNY